MLAQNDIIEEINNIDIDEYELQELLNQIKSYRELYATEKSKLELLEKQKEDLIEEIKEIDTNMYDVAEEKVLLEDSSEKARTIAKEVIEGVTTQSLQQIFNDGRTVSINLGTKAGQPTADLYVMHDGDDTDPAKEEGGGVADIISTAIFMILSDLMKTMSPFFLDEPNKYVSRDYSIQTGNFLGSIADYTGRQMFMNTHDEHLKTIGDVCYKMTKIGKTTEIEKIEIH